MYRRQHLRPGGAVVAAELDVGLPLQRGLALRHRREAQPALALPPPPPPASAAAAPRAGGASGRVGEQLLVSNCCYRKGNNCW